MIRAIVLFLAFIAAASAARAESVFSGGRFPPPRFELGSGSRVLGAGAVSSGLAGEPSDAAPVFGTAAWSLLVPGLAQRKLGRPVRARIYYGLETLSWIAAGSFLYAGYVREAAYKDYAVVFAGVSGTGRPDEYWEALGIYLSSGGTGGYNEIVMRDARDLYYPDVDAMNAYYDANAYVGDDAWEWRTSGDFRRYGKLRDDSRFAYRYALYSVFFAAVLRVVSTADAVYLMRADAADPGHAEGRTTIEFVPSPRGATLCLVRSF